VQFIYFNPQLHKYDTLKPRESLVVSGESFKNQDIASTDVGSFYQRIADADNTLKQSSSWPYSTWLINIFILAMLGISAYLVFKK
jgi:hypothetical protein